MNFDNQPEIEISGFMSSELAELTKFSCLFLGHSFVCRFAEWLSSSKNPFGTNLCIDALSSIQCLTGYTIPSLHKTLSMDYNALAHADIIIIDIGGNDLTEPNFLFIKQACWSIQLFSFNSRT